MTSNPADVQLTIDPIIDAITNADIDRWHDTRALLLGPPLLDGKRLSSEQIDAIWIEAFAAHRIAALQQSRSAVEALADCINTADSIIAEHCGIKDTPKEWLTALRKVTEARAALSQESADA